MNLRSLGYRTDLIFPKFDGEISGRDRYLIIRTPTNPTFYWGNFLLFAAPPGPDDYQVWLSLFRQEIGAPPQVNHVAFGWDTVNGELGAIQPFLDAGFQLNQSVVLTARQVRRPPKWCAEVMTRPLTEDWEWESALQNQIICRDAAFELEGYTLFKQRQMERYRAMARAGLGVWFGAFLHDRVVADLGVFVEGEVGRYQQVGTHPDYRRRGICGTLVYEAAQHALARFGVTTLVMVADEHYHAARIYESVGFQPAERQIGIDLQNHLHCLA